MSLQQPPLLDIKMDYDSEYLSLLCELEEPSVNIKDNETTEKNKFIKTRIDARSFLIKHHHDLHDDILEKNDLNAWIAYKKYKKN